MWGITRLIVAMGLFLTPGVVFAFSYSPTAADIDLAPGESSAVTFTFFHNEAGDREFYVQLVSARVGEGPDEIEFLPLYPGVAQWITLSDAAFTLSPGEVREISLSVALPQDVPTGVDVIGLQVIERASDDGMIGATVGVSPLVFLSVGDLPASANLVEFSSSKQVTDALPVSFLFNIENTGLRILQPDGSIVLRNMFGETIDVLDVNPQEKRVLSEVTRAYTVEWGSRSEQKGFFSGLTHEISHFTIGWIKAELTVTPWEGGEEISEELTVFFFPWRTLVVAAGVIAVLLGLFRVAKR